MSHLVAVRSRLTSRVGQVVGRVESVARGLLLACSCLAVCHVAFAQQERVYRAKPVEEWIRQLQDKNVRGRWYAIYALGQLGPQAGPAVEPLAKILKDQYENEYVRGGASWALGHIGAAAESTIPLLIETLKSKHVSVRRNSSRALGNLGAAAKPAAGALVHALVDEDPIVRVNAAESLWKIDRHPKALPALAEMIRHGKAPLPYEATVALGRMGPEADAAIPTLIMALDHPSSDVRRAGAQALGRMGPAALPALRNTLAHRNAEVCRSTVEALGWIGPPALPMLIEALGHADPAVRRSAARSLGRLGPSARDATGPLIEAVNDRNQLVREAAARALNKVRSPTDKPKTE